MRTCMQTVGQRWRAARAAAGLSATQAATLVGVHKNTIHDLEKDKDGATLRMMRRVAAVYGISLGEIFATEPARESVPKELLPLVEFIDPLPFEDRVALVLNVTTNLRFAASLARAPRDVDPPALTDGRIYNPQLPNTARSDGEADSVYAVGAGSVREANAAFRTAGEAPAAKQSPKKREPR